MFWKVIPLLFIALVSFAACGGRSASVTQTEEPLPTATPTQTQVATSTPTATPSATAVSSRGTPGQRIEGGTLVRLWDDPPTMDPHLTTDATSATYIVEVFGGLVTIDPDLNIVSDLAESWDVSDDGKIYTFHLREGIKFHNGKPVTAHDFQWSIDRAADPRTAAPVVEEYLGDIVGVTEKLKGEVTKVSGVRVIDDATLEVTIDEPKSYFLAKLTYPTAFVLDQENVESGRRWFREPNGTGPFKLNEYVPGTSLILARNEDYHLGPPHLDKVHFILSGGTSMLMYVNDEIQLTGVGLADLDRVLDPNDSLNAELNKAPPAFSTSYIGMNVNDPPFDDIKVRQALNYAIDKTAIARDVYAGLVIPATGILPPDFPAYNPDLRGYAYEPETAQQLLRESQYGESLENFDGPIILTSAGSFGANIGLDLEVILEMWRQNLGIEVEIQRTEFATYLQDLIKRRFQMFEIAWIADYPDPENFLDLLFHSESNNNHTGFSNAQVDELLVRARVESDVTARNELYRRAEEMILDEAPWIPLWYSGEQFVLIKPYVRDFYLTQLIIPKLRFVYMTER